MDSKSRQILEEAERRIKEATAKQESDIVSSMRLIVHVVTANSLNMVPHMSMIIHVGDGSQTVKWLSLAVSARLRHMSSSRKGVTRTRDNHELHGFFLPSSVNTAKTAKLVLQEMLAETLWPTDIINAHFKDGDEVFVSITTRPDLDDACCVKYTMWQDGAYHVNSPAAQRRLAEHATRQTRSKTVQNRMAKLRSAAWDAGVALRLQAIIGASPSMPHPPPAKVFGLTDSPTKKTGAPIPMLADALIEADEPVEKKQDDEVNAFGATQWLLGGNLNSLFEADYSRMTTPALITSVKEREALKSMLSRAYGPLRDVFRFYSNVMNAAVAVRTTMSFHRVGTESSAIESRFQMSRAELELLMRDCRILNFVTSPFVNPATIVALITSGEIKRQAAYLATQGQDSSQGALLGGRKDSVDAAISPLEYGKARYIGSATSPAIRRAIMELKPKLAAPESTGFSPKPTGISPKPTDTSESDRKEPSFASPQHSSFASPLASAGRISVANEAFSPTAKNSSQQGRRGSRFSSVDAKPPAFSLESAVDELDRVGFMDAVVLISAGLWEATKGHLNVRRNSLQMADKPATFSGAANGASLANGKLPIVRTHMLAHFLTNYIVPRSKHVQGTHGVRKEMISKKVAAAFLKEMNLLRFAYNKYATVGNGDDMMMDITGWRKFLLDCGLYQRIKPTTDNMYDSLLADIAASPRITFSTSDASTTVGAEDMRGKRLADRDLVMVFLLAQSEDDDSPPDSDVDKLAQAVAAGPKALAGTGISGSNGSLSELSFSEWAEALCRLALLKWDDPVMETHEKIARVIDAIAVRMITDPASGWKPDLADTARVATLTARLGGMRP